MVVGPDCQLPLESIENWTTRFLTSGAGDVLDAFSYHLYWLGSGQYPGRIRRSLVDRQGRAAADLAGADDASSASSASSSSSASSPLSSEVKPWPPERSFHSRVSTYEGVVGAAAPRAQVWVSESGGAYGSGAANVTDAFVSAFWYLDELGLLARRSVAVHCRQALVGGHYALLRRHPRRTFEANPDFFATRLWSALMGARALPATLRGEMNSSLRDARAYAHCRLAATRGHGFGDVVFLVVNSASRRALFLDPPDALRPFPRDEFHVTAPVDNDKGQMPNVDGRRVLLNGQPCVRFHLLSYVCH